MFLRHSVALFAAGLLFCPAAVPLAAGAPEVPDVNLPPMFALHRPPAATPIIVPSPAATFLDPILSSVVHWEALHTFNPAAVVRAGKVVVLYRAEDNSGATGIGLYTSRLGMAESTDGVHFTQRPEPVFYPAPDAQADREWPGGVEDPRIVESEDGTYVLTYTQWNRSTYTVGVATSRDLTHWTKYGPAFGSTGKYAGLKYKSAGILTRLVHGRLVAATLQGKYWMYWGEGKVGLATSADLVQWTPVETADGRPLTLLEPRPGRFDSGLPEVGPPPLLTDGGIYLLYNGKNAAGTNGNNAAGATGKNTAAAGDSSLAPGTYAVGLARFAAGNPQQLLERSRHPLLQPELPWERSGQYAAGTTFAEGLVLFHGRWFVYYGCADSLVGVVISEPEKRSRLARVARKRSATPVTDARNPEFPNRLNAKEHLERGALASNFAIKVSSWEDQEW